MQLHIGMMACTGWAKWNMSIDWYLLHTIAIKLYKWSNLAKVFVLKYAIVYHDLYHYLFEMCRPSAAPVKDSDRFASDTERYP